MKSFTVCAENCRSIFCASAKCISGDFVALILLHSSILATNFNLSFVVCTKLWKNPAHRDANFGLLLELNHLLHKVPLVKWIKVSVVAIWRLWLISLIPHLILKQLNVQSVLEVYWKQGPAWLLPERCYVYPQLFPQFPCLWNTTEIKSASFEVLHRFKEEAEVLFFHSNIVCIFYHRKVHSLCHNCTI